MKMEIFALLFSSFGTFAFKGHFDSLACALPLEEHFQSYATPGTRFSKVPKTFRARKAIRKTATR